jgi:hypothetical protein
MLRVEATLTHNFSETSATNHVLSSGQQARTLNRLYSPTALKAFVKQGRTAQPWQRISKIATRAQAAPKSIRHVHLTVFEGRSSSSTHISR